MGSNFWILQAGLVVFKLYVNWCKNKISCVYIIYSGPNRYTNTQISSKFSHRVLYTGTCKDYKLLIYISNLHLTSKGTLEIL